MSEAAGFVRSEKGSVHHSQYLSNYYTSPPQETTVRRTNQQTVSDVRVPTSDGRLRSTISPPVVIPRSAVTPVTIVHPQLVHEQPQAYLPDGGKVVGERVYRRELTGMRIIDIEEYNLLLSFKHKHEELLTVVRTLEQTVEEQRSVVIAANSRKSVRIEDSHTAAEFLEIRNQLDDASREIIKLRGIIDAKDEELRQRRMRASETHDIGSQSTLRRRLGELECELDTALSQKHELELKLKIMQAEVQAAIGAQKLMETDADTRVKRGEARIMSLEMRILELEDKLAQSQKEIREGRDRDLNISIHMSNQHNDSAEFDLEQLGLLKSLKAKNSDLEGLNLLLESRLRQREGRDKELKLDLEAEADKLRRDLADRERKLKENTTTIEEWQSKNESLQDEIGKLKSKLESSNRATEASQRALEFAERSLAEVSEQHKGCTSQLSKLKIELEDTQNSYDLLQQSKAAQSIQIRELQDGLAQIKDKFAQSEKGRSKLQETVESLEAELARAKERERDAQNQIKEFEDEIERLRGSLGKDIEVLHDEIKKRDEAIAEYERERNELVNKETEMLELIEEYKVALKNLEEERDLLTKEIEAFETTVNELSEQAANLRQLEDMSHKLLCDNATLSSQVSQLTQELEQLRPQPPTMITDPNLMVEASFQLQRLLETIAIKDAEIKQLHQQMNHAVSEANQRLFENEQIKIENTRLINERADCFQEYSRFVQAVQQPQSEQYVMTTH